MRKIILFLLLLAGCGNLKQDMAPAPFDEGQKRVETIICDSHEVGENGCVFSGGWISGSLKIYKIQKGSINILGLGCGVDYSATYSSSGGEWLDIDLRSLLKKDLEKDCILAITQKIELKNQEKLPFPIKLYTGTVTLGTCPSDVACSMEFTQTFNSNRLQTIEFSDESEGEYMLTGCGKTLIESREFSGKLSLPIGEYYQESSPGGCMFILAVAGDGLYKKYKKVWYYNNRVINLGAPVITLDKKTTRYVGDPSVMFTYVNGKLKAGSEGSFTHKVEGDYLRFYTSQGRSLIVFVKNGKILWTK